MKLTIQGRDAEPVTLAERRADPTRRNVHPVAAEFAAGRSIVIAVGLAVDLYTRTVGSGAGESVRAHLRRQVGARETWRATCLE